MPENGKTPENFKCSCGQIVEPPVLSGTLSCETTEGSFRASLPYKCPKCGKKLFTTVQGRIEKSLQKEVK